MANASRRGLLAALAVAPALAVPQPSPAADTTIDALFTRWLSVMAENDMTGLPDDEHDRLDAITQEIEKAICKASPCLDKAGVLTLIALRFGIPGLAMTPAGIEADADIVDMDATMALSSLPCLLPYLSGSVARIAADFLAHPNRQVRHSLLFRSGVEA